MDHGKSKIAVRDQKDHEQCSHEKFPHDEPTAPSGQPGLPYYAPNVNQSSVNQGAIEQRGVRQSQGGGNEKMPHEVH